MPGSVTDMDTVSQLGYGTEQALPKYVLTVS